MLTPEERREKAHKHFISTWGEQKGTELWKDYCRKSGLLEEEAPPKKKKKAEKSK